MAGLTPAGFEIKTFDQIRSNIAANLQVALGQVVDTSPSSRIGQFVDIVSNEIFACWQGLEAIYNSWYPNSASGASLDNVASITNTTRLAASPSVAFVYVNGTVGVDVPVGTIYGKTGTSVTVVQTGPAQQITMDAFSLMLSAKAASGQIVLRWTISPGVFQDVTIPWDATENVMKTLCESILSITEATVDGEPFAAAAIHFYFNGITFPAQLPTVFANSLADEAAGPITASIFASVANPIEVQASSPGPTPLPTMSIMTILSTIPNTNGVYNPDSGTAGRNRETDAELRDRRIIELQKVGTVTPGGIREAVLAVAQVTSCSVVENDTSVVDVAGRPPHSYEVYAAGGDDDEVAQTIYDCKPIGINPVSTNLPTDQRTGAYIDVNGVNQIMIYSAPVRVPIRLIVNITVDPAIFPTDGATQVIDTLILYFTQYDLGDDILNHMLFTPINTVPGILTLSVLQGKTAAGVPSTSANIVILQNEVATLATTDVAVNVS